MSLNGKLGAEQLMEWVSLAGPAQWNGDVAAWLGAASVLQWLILGGVLPTIAGLVVMLLWMIFRPERPVEVREAPVTADEVFDAAARVDLPIRRVGVALEVTRHDAGMLAEAVSVAAANNAELVLMHVVEGAGGQYHVPVADDAEVRSDDEYLRQIAERLSADGAARVLGKPSVASVRTVLGFGDVTRELDDGPVARPDDQRRASRAGDPGAGGEGGANFTANGDLNMYRSTMQTRLQFVPRPIPRATILRL